MCIRFMSGKLLCEERLYLHNFNVPLFLPPFLPDFLCNINGYEMGFASVRSSKSIRSSDEEEEEKLGRRVGDVELPPWAKGNPREFIRLHRFAFVDHVESSLPLLNPHSFIS